MATTEDLENTAISSESSNVVKDVTAKEAVARNRLSRQNKVLENKKEMDLLKDSFTRKMAQYSKVAKPFAMDWGDSPLPGSPEALVLALQDDVPGNSLFATEENEMVAYTVPSVVGGDPVQLRVSNVDASVDVKGCPDRTFDSGLFQDLPGTPPTAAEGLLGQYSFKASPPLHADSAGVLSEPQMDDPDLIRPKYRRDAFKKKARLVADPDDGQKFRARAASTTRPRLGGIRKGASAKTKCSDFSLFRHYTVRKGVTRGPQFGPVSRLPQRVLDFSRHESQLISAEVYFPPVKPLIDPPMAKRVQITPSENTQVVFPLLAFHSSLQTESQPMTVDKKSLSPIPRTRLVRINPFPKWKFLPLPRQFFPLLTDCRPLPTVYIVRRNSSIF
ncbi:hypothetical protein AVEN_41060-1 [Araneus ventricosus]|uniref:Uncharacterized protein n=1 Tax=Araneus ventricosus TaxID=182803 RepID=A0A4Y2CIM2_ARAVE|nr:hypothetical protein AVEN_41060-1 [Araneus ventricosus]